jgi:hypothetical protein
MHNQLSRYREKGRAPVSPGHISQLRKFKFRGGSESACCGLGRYGSGRNSKSQIIMIVRPGSPASHVDPRPDSDPGIPGRDSDHDSLRWGPWGRRLGQRCWLKCLPVVVSLARSRGPVADGGRGCHELPGSCRVVMNKLKSFSVDCPIESESPQAAGRLVSKTKLEHSPASSFGGHGASCAATTL